MQRYRTAVQQRGQQNFAVWYTRNGITELSQSAPPIFGWAAITLGIGPDSSILLLPLSLCLTGKKIIEISAHCVRCRQ